MSKLVSIIIPTHNTVSFIVDSVRSVLAQTYQNKEIIVVDDGSTDNTRAVLEKYIESGEIKYFHQENKGPGAARNLGIKNSSGKFIAFLDADDIWLPDKLKKQMLLFQDNNVGLVYSDMDFFGDKFPFKTYSEMVGRFYRGDVFGRLLLRNFVPISSVVVHRSAIERNGYFTEEKEIFAIEDYEMWLRMARNVVFDFVLEPLVKYRVHQNQISKDYIGTYEKLSRLYAMFLFDASPLYTPVIIVKYVENKIKYFIRKL